MLGYFNSSQKLKIKWLVSAGFLTFIVEQVRPNFRREITETKSCEFLRVEDRSEVLTKTMSLVAWFMRQSCHDQVAFVLLMLCWESLNA